MKSKALPWLVVLLGTLFIIGGGIYKGTDYFSHSRDSHRLVLNVGGVRNGTGVLRATLCRQSEAFPNDCEFRSVARAQKGVTPIYFASVPDGFYAIAVFHDEDQDNVIGMYQGRRVPREGIAFGNDALSDMGVPSFEQARVDLNGQPQRLRMRYLL